MTQAFATHRANRVLFRDMCLAGGTAVSLIFVLKAMHVHECISPLGSNIRAVNVLKLAFDASLFWACLNERDEVA